MPVIIKLSTGDSHMLDRNLSASEVTRKVNDGRSGGKLIAFQDNNTPSRTIYIDPAHVVTVRYDGHSY